MAMKSLPRLYWQPVRRVPARMLVLLAGCAVVAAALGYAKLQLDARVADRGAQLDRMVTLAARRAPKRPAPKPALSPAARHQLERQLVLLNRDWAGLTRRLAPTGHRVDLLGMDIDPASGSIHVSGRADSTTVANAYALALSKQADVLRQVRLLQLEQDDDGIRFEISAQWID